LTQSVLLKGVNDDEKVLIELFTRLTQEGYRPYYLFQNDPVYWADHFTVSIKKAIILWQKLRPKLSGIAATARFVIDVPEGYGKIAVPEGGAWEVNYRYYKDFKGRKKQLE
jgi:lysine 2,3-aminomutase